MTFGTCSVVLAAVSASLGFNVRAWHVSTTLKQRTSSSKSRVREGKPPTALGRSSLMYGYPSKDRKTPLHPLVERERQKEKGKRIKVILKPGHRCHPHQGMIVVSPYRAKLIKHQVGLTMGPSGSGIGAASSSTTAQLLSSLPASAGAALSLTWVDFISRPPS